MNSIIQLSFDYEMLDSETRVFIQEKAQAIHARLRRTAEDIVCVGADLIAVKQRLKEENGNKRGTFEAWIQTEFEMSRVAAHRFMQVAERFGEIYSNLKDISISVLYELAAPSTPEVIIEQVQSGEIAPTLEAIREAKEAQKQAEEAEQKARSVATQLSKQIEDLQHQIATISKPEKVIEEKEVIPPEITSQIETLQAKVKKLTEQRNNLAQKAETLGEQARQAVLKRNEEEKEQRIRLGWRKTMKDFQVSIAGLLAQIPTPNELEVFEAEDWERLSRSKELARRFLSECDLLSSRSSMVVEAG